MMNRRDFLLLSAALTTQAAFAHDLHDQTDHDYDESPQTTNSLNQIIRSAFDYYVPLYTNKKATRLAGGSGCYEKELRTMYHMNHKNAYTKRQETLYAKKVGGGGIKMIPAGNDRFHDQSRLRFPEGSGSVSCPWEIADSKQLFPGDYVFMVGMGYGTDPSFRDGRISRKVQDGFLSVNLSGVQGDSGNFVYAFFDGDPRLVGVFAYGTGIEVLTPRGNQGVLGHLNLVSCLDHYVEDKVE